tara:strand:+ start:1218 stop:1415 length:198 start_codon:yes stop_codon:yes gene_type:complete
VSQSSGIGVFNKSASKQSLTMKYNTIDKNDINIVKPSYNGSKKNSKPELESEPLESNQNDEVKIE